MKYILPFFLFLPFLNFGQFGFVYDSSIPVSRGNQPLTNAWAGGLNYIQLSDFDYDFDGDEDLFIFDRANNNIRVFENYLENGVRRYRYVHDAFRHFPANIYHRATLVDYDNDGRKDIFCYGLGGLMVYRNVGNSVDGLAWELTKDIVYSSYNGVLYNLAVTSADIPAIVDVDGDGDIDVLTFHMGGSHLEYHKNLSMETYGVPDSLHFVLMNECWGKFEENVNDNSITLNATEYPCVNGNIGAPEYPLGSLPRLNLNMQKHSGSNVLALDYDGNGVLDLVLGDISFTNLVLLINGGTEVNSDSPMVSYDMNFPSNTTPTNLNLFPAAFYVDVNFDGKKDLVVGANARNVSNNTNSIWFYENVGTDTQPSFIYRNSDFLQNTMIDHGRGSVPVLVDVDRDGLVDLLVSNFYSVKPNGDYESKIAYYKNTGTTTSPSFTYIENDWLNLSSQNLGLRIIPTFGDVNGDGIRDLIIGKNDGRLTLSPGTSNSFQFSSSNLLDDQNQIINVGSYAHPQLFDLNQDGLLDLVIGNSQGKLFYYQNIGSASQPRFKYITDQLGGINLAILPESKGYSAPHFFRHGNATHLFLGHSEGRMRYYNQIDENLNSLFQLVHDEYLDINVEGYSSFFVQDIDQDGQLNLFVGLDLGGVHHFRADPNSSIEVEKIEVNPDIKLYPNPSRSGLFHFQYLNIEILEYRVFDIAGNLLLTCPQLQSLDLDLSTFQDGIYLVQVVTSNGQMIKRIIKG